MPTALISLLSSLGSIIGSVASSVVGMVLSTTKKAVSDAWSQVRAFNDMSIATTREMGRTYAQSIQYTNTLIQRTKDLSIAYGITAQQIAKVQDAINKSTGRATYLSNAQAEDFVAISKVMGDQAVSDFTSTIVRTMGGSISVAADAAIAAYTKASKVGLNAVDFSAKVARNLEMANRVSFRDGIDGITRMTALSEKLGFNLSSIEGAMAKYEDFSEAITTSANLQALGGNFAIFGGNPLNMMYEALNDAESFTERMTDMMSGWGTFDAKTGISELKGYGLYMVKEAAKQAGMNPADAVAMVKNRNKINYIDSAARGQFRNLDSSNLENKDEIKDWIRNQGQVREGKVYLNLADGRRANIEDLDANTMERLFRESTMSDKEAFMDGAQRIVSVSERIEGAQSLIGAMLAEKALPFLETIQEFLVNDGTTLAKVVANGLAILVDKNFWISSFAKVGSFLLDGLQAAFNITMRPIMTAVGTLAMGLGSVVSWIAGKDLGGKITNIGSGLLNFTTNRWSSSLDKYTNTKSENLEAFKSGVSELWSRGKEYYNNFSSGREDAYSAEFARRRERIYEEEEGRPTFNETLPSRQASSPQPSTIVALPSTQPRTQASSTPSAVAQPQAVNENSECTLCDVVRAIENLGGIVTTASSESNAQLSAVAENTSPSNSNVTYYAAAALPSVSQGGGGEPNTLQLPVAEQEGGERFAATPLNAATGLGLIGVGGNEVLRRSGAYGNIASYLKGGGNTAPVEVASTQGGPIKAEASSKPNETVSNKTKKGVQVKGEKLSREATKATQNGRASNISAQTKAATPTSTLNAGKALGASKGAKLLKLGGKVGVGLIAGIGGELINGANERAIANGKYKRGGLQDIGLSATSNALQFAAWGGMLGGPVGAGIGALGGLLYGGFKAYYDGKKSKKEEEERNKAYAEESARRENATKAMAIGGSVSEASSYQVGVSNDTDSLKAFAQAKTERDIAAAKAKQGGVFGQMAASMQGGEVSAAETTPEVMTKPIGEDAYQIRPSSQGTAPLQVGMSDINVNLNLNGTLNLVAPNGSQAAIGADTLLTNTAFIMQLTDMIRNELSKMSYGGRRVNDPSTTTGNLAYNQTWG